MGLTRCCVRQLGGRAERLTVVGKRFVGRGDPWRGKKLGPASSMGRLQDGQHRERDPEHGVKTGDEDQRARHDRPFRHPETSSLFPGTHSVHTARRIAADRDLCHLGPGTKSGGGPFPSLLVGTGPMPLPTDIVRA